MQDEAQALETFYSLNNYPTSRILKSPLQVTGSDHDTETVGSDHDTEIVSEESDKEEQVSLFKHTRERV